MQARQQRLQRLGRQLSSLRSVRRTTVSSIQSVVLEAAAASRLSSPNIGIDALASSTDHPLNIATAGNPLSDVIAEDDVIATAAERPLQSVGQSETGDLNYKQ